MERTERSFGKNGKERKERNVLLKRTNAQPWLKLEFFSKIVCQIFRNRLWGPLRVQYNFELVKIHQKVENQPTLLTIVYAKCVSILNTHNCYLHGFDPQTVKKSCYSFQKVNFLDVIFLQDPNSSLAWASYQPTRRTKLTRSLSVSSQMWRQDGTRRQPATVRSAQVSNPSVTIHSQQFHECFQ